MKKDLCRKQISKLQLEKRLYSKMIFMYCIKYLEINNLKTTNVYKVNG